MKAPDRVGQQQAPFLRPRNYPDGRISDWVESLAKTSYCRRVRRFALVWLLFIACWQAGASVFPRGLPIPLSGNYLARAAGATARLATSDDGNLPADDHCTYTWDAKNRLSSKQSLPGVPDEAKRRVDCAYDAEGRREDVFQYDMDRQKILEKSAEPFQSTGCHNKLKDITNQAKDPFTESLDENFSHELE
jgi:hypothetical protein